MTDHHQTNNNEKTVDHHRPEQTPPRTGFGLRDGLQFFLCLLAVGGTLAYLMRPAKNAAQAVVQASAQAAPEVSACGYQTIFVRSDSALFQKLHLTEAVKKTIEDPLCRVTGTVAAVKTNVDGESQWQFHSPELLTAYGDWRRSLADVSFAEEQLKATNRLSETKIKTLSGKIERKRQLVAIGTDTQLDLAELEAELIEQEIENSKAVHEAETALRSAENAATVSTRQLEQEGIEPDLLDSDQENLAIVMANIPETLFDSVRVGQRCRLRFSGIPDKSHDGEIAAIVPFVSKELRSMRALFTVESPHALLRAGMFADVELGIDPRDVLLVPTEAVVHIGRDDYVLCRIDEEHWRVAPVETGPSHEDDVEIVRGICDGETIVGLGAILLKAAMIDSLDESVFPETIGGEPQSAGESQPSDTADNSDAAQSTDAKSSEPQGEKP